MRIIFSLLIFLIIIFGVTVSTHATLWNRGGGLIYDDVLKITWLQDANYAQTSGYEADGEMTWSQAVAWADQLTYGGYDDWRLPQTLPVNGASYNYNLGSTGVICCNGSTDDGTNISAPGSAYPGSTGSEMAYMYYNNLKNVAYYDLGARGPQPGWSESKNVSFIDGSNNLVSFQNLQDTAFYWSDTISALDPRNAWAFYFFFGDQMFAGKVETNAFSWAVRSGDVTPVPEPSTMLLLGSGLIGILGFRKRLRKS